jgi:GT2 family glycosyltransferase
MNPTLSVIILSYNTSKLTLDCLHSVFKDRGLEFAKPTNSEKIPTEIILVDNASKDNSVQAIKKFKKGLTNPSALKLIENKKNLGFAVANNQAIKKARGNFVLLLNSDTLILNSSISQSLNWLSAHPKVGVCTGQLLNKDRTIQPSGGYFPSLSNLFTWSLHLDDLPLVNLLIPPLHPHPPHFYLRSSFYKSTHPQDWVTGAFLLFRKSLIGKIGLLNEDFFMYAEELEWCYRAQKAGWEIYYLVGPQIIHLGGQSSQTSQNSLWGEYQGLLKFFKLHRPSWQHLPARTLLKLNCFIGIFLKCLQFKFADAKIHYQVLKKI